MFDEDISFKTKIGFLIVIVSAFIVVYLDSLGDARANVVSSIITLVISLYPIMLGIRVINSKEESSFIRRFIFSIFVVLGIRYMMLSILDLARLIEIII